MVYVQIQLGEGYMVEVARRMKRARPKILKSELARALGKHPTQIGLWFHKNPEKRVHPTIIMAERIEEAMLRLERARER